MIAYMFEVYAENFAFSLQFLELFTYEPCHILKK